jgi:hypothetical protein
MLSVAIARWRGAGRIAIVSLLGIAMLIFIFQMGYDVGEGYVNGTVPTHVLNDNVYGRLIRAGERGVLFVSREPKAIVFRRWDDIRSIRTIELSQSDKEKIKSEARKLFSRF